MPTASLKQFLQDPLSSADSAVGTFFTRSLHLFSAECRAITFDKVVLHRVVSTYRRQNGNISFVYWLSSYSLSSGKSFAFYLMQYFSGHFLFSFNLVDRNYNTNMYYIPIYKSLCKQAKSIQGKIHQIPYTSLLHEKLDIN